MIGGEAERATVVGAACVRGGRADGADATGSRVDRHMCCAARTILQQPNIRIDAVAAHANMVARS